MVAKISTKKSKQYTNKFCDTNEAVKEEQKRMGQTERKT